MLCYTVGAGERSLGVGHMLNLDEKIEIGYNCDVSITAAPSKSILLMHEMNMSNFLSSMMGICVVPSTRSTGRGAPESCTFEWISNDTTKT